jgi:hypothetical protein
MVDKVNTLISTIKHATGIVEYIFGLQLVVLVCMLSVSALNQFCVVVILASSKQSICPFGARRMMMFVDVSV